MNKIILFRHGEHEDDCLTNEGKKQIHELMQKLDIFIGKSQDIKIFTSTFARTKMSAEIIAQGLKVEKITTINIIGEDDIDEDKIYDFIKSEEAQAEIVILATHVQHVRFFPQFFSFVEWATDKEIDEIEPGEAVMIDCLDKKIIELKRS
ncbi:MAG: histidine phosphatase family protein [Candidatus Falkowbacteria bacterium]|nr:histidine phosphatase family protein [Candidatus Falkowbacteria bacterium]